MPLTRSQQLLPDKVVHDYPIDRRIKKQKVPKDLTDIEEKVSKSTETIGLGEEYGELAIALAEEEQLNKTEDSLIIKEGEIVDDDQIIKDTEKIEEKTKEFIELETEKLANIEKTLTDLINSGEESDLSDKESEHSQVYTSDVSGNIISQIQEIENRIDVLEVGRIVANSESLNKSLTDSTSSFNSARGYLTPNVRFNTGINASSTHYSRSQSVDGTNKNYYSIKSCIKSVTNKTKSAPGDYINQFESNSRTFGIFANRSKSSSETSEVSTSSNNVIIGNNQNKSDKLDKELSSNVDLTKFESINKSQSIKKRLSIQKTPLLVKNSQIKNRGNKVSRPSKIKVISNEVVKNLFENMKPIASIDKNKNREEPRKIKNSNGGGDGGDGGGDDDDDNNGDKGRRSPFKIGPSFEFEKSGRNMGNGGMGNLRDALRFIPEFDGKRSSLNRYLSGIDDAFDLIGSDFEQLLLKLAKNKLVGEVWNRVSKNNFNNIDEYKDYLRNTFDPPSDIFQLQGELGSSAQLDDETVDKYAYRIQELVEKMKEAVNCKNGCLTYNDKVTIEEMAITCFKTGLKPEVLDKMNNEEESLGSVINFAKATERDLANRRKLREKAKSKTSSNKEIEKNLKKVSIKLVEPEDDEVSMAPFVAGDILKCQYCNKTGHLANQCPELNKPKENIDICQYCGKRGHVASKCYAIPCKTCGRKGHSIEQCRENGAVVKPEKNENPSPIVSNFNQNRNQNFQNQGNQGMLNPNYNGNYNNQNNNYNNNNQNNNYNNNQNYNQNRNYNNPNYNQNRNNNNYQGYNQNRNYNNNQNYNHNGNNYQSRNYNQTQNHDMGQGRGNNQMTSNENSMSYAQAAGQAPRIRNPNIICHYCNERGHVLYECLKREQDNVQRNRVQGNENGQSMGGAQVKANSEAHPILAVQAGYQTMPE